MRKNAIVIIVVLMLAGWGIYDYLENNKNETISQDQATLAADVGLNKGNIAPDFELMSGEGLPVKLSDFKGKHVILNFWATWCPPCRAEMPHMERFYNDHQSEVVVLAVNLTNTEKNASHVTEFVDKYKLTFPIVMDTTGNVAGMYNIFAYPTSYIIDTQGIIRDIFRGPISYEIMDKAIAVIR